MAKLNLSAGTLVAIGFVAIIALFLFGKLFTQGATGLEFVNPDPAAALSWGFTILKIAIVAMAVWVGAASIGLMTKGSIGRRDIVTLILIGIVVYFAWEYIFSKIMSAGSLENITFAVGQKFGMFP